MRVRLVGVDPAPAEESLTGVYRLPEPGISDTPALLRLLAPAWLVVTAAMSVPLFLGGGSGPVLPDLAWQLVKTVLVLVGLVLVRAWLPLVRADRFEEIAWLVLLPAVLAQALVVSVLVL